ncbi:hypothetical protein [Limoniibacter endophyticus]|uniref:hypothetical protein n=1 Tax=Limoniibacter endophyticus TaxID=1565040 RepID=UPI001671C4BB|nr:hypothetical protein [Limoniibacter endophyticus]
MPTRLPKPVAAEEPSAQISYLHPFDIAGARAVSVKLGSASPRPLAPDGYVAQRDTLAALTRLLSLVEKELMEAGDQALKERLSLLRAGEARKICQSPARQAPPRYAGVASVLCPYDHG